MKFIATVRQSLSEFVFIYNSFVSYVMKKIQDWERILGFNTQTKSIGDTDIKLSGQRIDLYFDPTNSSYVVNIIDITSSNSVSRINTFNDSRVLFDIDVGKQNTQVISQDIITIDASTGTNFTIDFTNYNYPNNILIDIINQNSDVSIVLSENTSSRPTYMDGFISYITIRSDSDAYNITIDIDPILSPSQAITITNADYINQNGYFVANRILILYNFGNHYLLKDI